MSKKIILTESQFKEVISAMLNERKFGLEADPKTREREINNSWKEIDKQYSAQKRVTPAQINSLGDNEVFVFGSNLRGLHGGGAARFAYDNFGAEWENGVGMQGKSYAIPTLSLPGGAKEHMLSVSEIGRYVNDFLNFAQNHPELTFYVTPIGCGIAGFKPIQIAPLFKDATFIDNVYLPAEFWKIINHMN